MSSAIFYRFRSQKEPSRILFDGTGITVFDLKKEIINVNKLGAGLDFDLRLYHSETQTEEYEDDTQVIPRSTLVLARRSPSLRNKGTASRYVTGKPRILKNKIVAPTTSSQPPTAVDASQSEEDRIKMMFKNQDDVWKETQASMSNATPVYTQRPANGVGTDDLPPPGYICYRCGAKDHWIKNCPTNDDPNFEGKRIKRTTGIPKSYLKTVEKPSENEDTGNYMITEDGQYVVAVADTKAWESYQKKSAQTQVDIDIDDPELVDPITKKLLHKPVITPCCTKTYSQESIENALLERDFVCPNCQTGDILLDSLKPNEEINEKVKKFLEENQEKLGLKRPVEDAAEQEANKRMKLEGNMPMMPPFVPPFAGMPFPGMPMMMPPPSQQR